MQALVFIFLITYSSYATAMFGFGIGNSYNTHSTFNLERAVQTFDKSGSVKTDSCRSKEDSSRAMDNDRFVQMSGPLDNQKMSSGGFTYSKAYAYQMKLREMQKSGNKTGLQNEVKYLQKWYMRGHKEELKIAQSILNERVTDILSTIKNGTVEQAQEAIHEIFRLSPYKHRHNTDTDLNQFGPTFKSKWEEYKNKYTFDILEEAKKLYESRECAPSIWGYGYQLGFLNHDPLPVQRMPVQNNNVSVSPSTEVNYRQLHDHVTQQCMTLQEKTGSVSDYYQMREKVLAKVVAGDLAVLTQKYELCPQAQDAMQQYALDSAQFTMCTGNLLQQDTHAKLVTSLNKLAQKPAVTQAAHQMQEGVLECAYAGNILNQQGKVQEAMMLADICHIAVDYVWQGIDIGVSISKGIAQGVYVGVAAEINTALQSGTGETLLKAGCGFEPDLAGQVAAETALVVGDLVRFAKNAGEVALSGVAGVGDAIIGLPELLTNCVEMTQLTIKSIGYISCETATLLGAAESNDAIAVMQQLDKMQHECGQVVDGVSSYLSQLKHHPLLHKRPITHDDLKYCARVGGRMVAEGVIFSHAIKGCASIMEGTLTQVKSIESACVQLQHVKDVSVAQVRSAFLSADIALASPVAKVSSALGPEYLMERVIGQAELATAPIVAETAVATQEVTKAATVVKDICQSAVHVEEPVQATSVIAVNVPKKLDPKITALTYATKELKEQVKPYLAEHKAKQQQLCTEHNVYKENRVHQVTEFEGNDQKLWDVHAVSDLEIDKLAKPFDYTCRTHKDKCLPEHMLQNPKPIRFEHEHIRRPDIRVTKCNQEKPVYAISGFHHDPMGSLENSGLIDIKNKIELSHGCYEYEWKYRNTEFKESTFFPKEWSSAKVYEKTLESLKNTVEIKYKEGAVRYRHIGQTKEGLKIITVIEFDKTSARIVSAYPYFGEK